jgi:hypothetical protein
MYSRLLLIVSVLSALMSDVFGQVQRTKIVLDTNTTIQESGVTVTKKECGSSAPPKPSTPCWKKLPENYVWVNTLGLGHVQMGYISFTYDTGNEATSYPSGQPIVGSLDQCIGYCDALGPMVCAAAQYFACSTLTPVVSWCNLLTPIEYSTASNVTSAMGVNIVTTEPTWGGRLQQEDAI